MRRIAKAYLLVCYVVIGSYLIGTAHAYLPWNWWPSDQTIFGILALIGAALFAASFLPKLKAAFAPAE